MKKLIFMILLVTLMGVFSTLAQQGVVRMTIGLSGARPLGQFKSLVDKTTFRGGDLSVLYGINDLLSVGLNTGFQDFYQKFPRALYKLSDGSDISAVLTNSVQTIPVLLTAQFRFASDAKIQPYVSAGAGGAMVMNSQFIGEYPNDDDKISFALRPGAGMFLPFRKEGEVGFNLGVNYTFIPYKSNTISNLGYFGLTIGIGFPVRN
jgi:hypothetical protein